MSKRVRSSLADGRVRVLSPLCDVAFSV
jgi:hypothetical protein